MLCPKGLKSLSENREFACSPAGTVELSPGRSPGSGVSTYFGVANWPAEDIFAVFGQRTAQAVPAPDFLVRGNALDFSPGSNPRDRSGYIVSGL